MFERTRISQEGDGNLTIVNSTVSISTAGEELQKLLQEGRHVEANALFERMMRGVYAMHPAHPHWRYDLSMEGGKAVLSHVPNYPEAVDKFPMKGNIIFQLPDKYKNFKNMQELLRYAYGKQEEIEIDVSSLRTWIGEHLIDEQQSGDNIKIKAILKPHNFPDPSPMKLYIKGSEFSIDYLEIGVSEIVGQVVTLDNNKQENSKIYLTLKINLENNHANFNIRIKEDFFRDVEANLLLNHFLFEVGQGKPFALKMLREGKDFFVSQKWTLDSPKSEISEDYLRFLADLMELQEYYEVDFRLSDTISDHDLECVHILKLAKENSLREGKYNDFKINVDDKQSIMNIIEKDAQDPNGHDWSLVSYKKTIAVFGAVVTFDEYQLEFRKAVLKNKDKIRQKLELLDDGETLVLQFEPANAEENSFAEYYILRSRSSE